MCLLDSGWRGCELARSVRGGGRQAHGGGVVFSAIGGFVRSIAREMIEVAGLRAILKRFGLWVLRNGDANEELVSW